MFSLKHSHYLYDVPICQYFRVSVLFSLTVLFYIISLCRNFSDTRDIFMQLQFHSSLFYFFKTFCSHFSFNPYHCARFRNVWVSFARNPLSVIMWQKPRKYRARPRLNFTAFIKIDLSVGLGRWIYGLIRRHDQLSGELQIWVKWIHPVITFEVDIEAARNSSRLSSVWMILRKMECLLLSYRWISFTMYYYRIVIIINLTWAY